LALADNLGQSHSSKLVVNARRAVCTGEIQSVYTKTTVVLAPLKKSKWRKIRKAIESNLNSLKHKVGKATYANLRSGRCFECVMTRKKRWKRVK
jgi:hypothetical protein